MEILKEIGLVGKSIANTGVVATIYGNGPGNTIAIRADMDGLEVDEELTPFNANYISQHPGFMHSCGHDGHMAIVLGAARLIMQHSASFSGSVRLIFQPAEEQPPGGALNIINEGGLRGVDAILGLHVFGSVNAGEIKLKCGPFLATSNIFTLTVTGKGGHHLSPELNIDSISIGSQFIGCIKKEIEKKLSEDQFRIGVGKISGGAQFNRTPDNVEILGSFRTFHRHDAALIETILQQTLDTLMSMYAKQEYPGLPMYELNIVHGYPALVNDSAFSQRAINI
jgi:amidohydrolase